MKTIVHTCSSILLRPNGITRYINAVIDLQKSLGHRVIFVSDAKPTQTMHTDEVYYVNAESTYVPNFRDGHVWLQVDQSISDTITQVFTENNIKPDLLISHDLHSFLGCEQVATDGIFVQHESDVLNEGRYSYISDEYLDLQLKVVHETEWRVGLTCKSKKISPKRPLFTPMPFTVANLNAQKTKGLLYIGDSSDRKGAKEFMAVARELGVTPTVITHDPDSEVFFGANVYSFGLPEREQMYHLIAQHKVAFIPSKNETGCISLMECLQFTPTVVDSQYPWTHNVADYGVVLSTGTAINQVIKDFLSEETSIPEQFKIWAEHSKQFWINLSV